ncbi:MAG: hypothetical protein PWQ96_1016 [Clostridia bacterium]|nr:hypothetical protein [Clostridia bacterium]
MKILLIIFSIQIAFVSVLTLRTIFMIKGRTLYASLVSFLEVLVYVIGLSMVLQNLDKPLNLIVYCLGFSVGIWVGSFIERWMALGYVTVQIITTKLEPDIPQKLRDKGFGATNWYGNGQKGERQIISVLAKRKDQKKLFNLINEIDPKAFVVSYEPTSFHGGFLARRLRKL